jgi:uncharacterized membrane protein YeaQ/YmgE (transglycosylase-associated protein family)
MILGPIIAAVANVLFRVFFKKKTQAQNPAKSAAAQDEQPPKIARDTRVLKKYKERTNMLHFIGWMIIGALIGWVASKIMHGKGGLIRNIIVGIAGSGSAVGWRSMPESFRQRLVDRRLSDRGRWRVYPDPDQQTDTRQELTRSC